MIACGIPTTRRPAFDLGGPSSISPVDRSMKAARTRTVPVSRSRSTAPQCGYLAPSQAAERSQQNEREVSPVITPNRPGPRQPSSTTRGRLLICVPYISGDVRISPFRRKRSRYAAPGSARMLPTGRRPTRSREREDLRDSQDRSLWLRPRHRHLGYGTGSAAGSCPPRPLSSSTARSSRYALAVTETDTPSRSISARHSRIMASRYLADRDTAQHRCDVLLQQPAVEVHCARAQAGTLGDPGCGIVGKLDLAPLGIGPFALRSIEPRPARALSPRRRLAFVGFHSGSHSTVRARGSGSATGRMAAFGRCQSAGVRLCWPSGHSLILGPHIGRGHGMGHGPPQ